MLKDTRSTKKKSVSLLWKDNKSSGKEIRKITPFNITTSSIKYLRITLTKQVEDLYDRNFESLMKEIEEDTRKWNDLPYSWVGRINIVTMATLPKAIHRLNGLPFKVSTNSSQTSKEWYSISYGKANISG